MQNQKFKILRKKYPKFIYQDYFYKLKGGNLEISFLFVIEPNIYFQPMIIIKNVKKSQLKMVGDKILDNLIFHIGLIEILSYWKATCSPEIIIKAGYLNSEQLRWWKKLIINGMGQFFYENQINFLEKNLFKIIVNNQTKKDEIFVKNLKNRCLVPFAGGRDSIVTLESLKKKKKKIMLFMVNPTKQILKTAKVSSVKKMIIVQRVIDKKLLDLNKKGFLNGHTPFTSVLSFISVLCAILFDCKNIVFSNEKSADEGNVKYLGRIINHQWAKSSEFEKIFKNYCRKYLAENINYFSYLRKYGELEISKMFIKYPQYFSVFSSCNASMKIGAKKLRWCGKCPKCLFVYLTLYPFLENNELLKIFNKDFFQNKKLLPLMKSLIGEESIKPFECVGTKKESQEAFKLCLKKAKKLRDIPYLLTKI